MNSKLRMAEQVRDVALRAGEEIVDAEHVVPLLEQAVDRDGSRESRRRRSPSPVCACCNCEPLTPSSAICSRCSVTVTDRPVCNTLS